MANPLPIFSAAMALLLALAAHCLADDKAALPIIGRWSGDALPLLLADKNMPEEMKAKFKEMPEHRKPRITVTYSADGSTVSTLNMGGRTQNATGTWELLHRNGSEIRIRTVGNKQQNTAEVTFQMDGTDRMTMTNSDRPGTITLNRTPDIPRPRQFDYPPLKFSTSTGDEKWVWSTADEPIISMLNSAASAGVVAHARKSKPEADAATVDTAILFMCSKLPLGALADNPNILLAKEKAWSEQFQQTGAGYFEVLKDRVKVLNAPTEFSGEPKEIKIGNSTFHVWDAVNSKVVGVKQKQRYICTYRDGYYVYFVLSYDMEGDADFGSMMRIVDSFTEFPAP